LHNANERFFKMLESGTIAVDDEGAPSARDHRGVSDSEYSNALLIRNWRASG